MKSELPFWLFVVIECSKGLGVLILGLVGVWIAYRQMHIAKEKLKSDHFEKRFKLFEHLSDALLKFHQHGHATDECIRQMTQVSHTASILFPEEFAKQIESWRIKLLNSNLIDIRLQESELSQTQRETVVSQRVEMTMELSNLYNNLGSIFRPHMLPRP